MISARSRRDVCEGRALGCSVGLVSLIVKGHKALRLYNCEPGLWDAEVLYSCTSVLMFFCTAELLCSCEQVLTLEILSSGNFVKLAKNVIESSL